MTAEIDRFYRLINKKVQQRLTAEGVSMIQTNPINGGATFPASPTNGDYFFRTDLNQLCRYNSTSVSWEHFTNTFNKTTSATLDDSGFYIVDSTAGAMTLTIPDAASANAGMFICVHRDAGTNNVTIQTTSSQSIDGSTTQVLTANGQALAVVSNGTAWHIVQDSRGGLSGLTASRLMKSNATGNGLEALTGTGFVKLTSDAVSVDALTASELPTGTLKCDASISSTLQAIEDTAGTVSALQIASNRIYVQAPSNPTASATSISAYMLATPSSSGQNFAAGGFDTAVTGSQNVLFVRGLIGSAYAYTSGTTTVCEGLLFEAGARGGSGTVTSAYGIHIYIRSDSGNTVTTGYGLYLDTIQGTGGTVGAYYSLYNAQSGARFMAKLPTSSFGLASGELWCDTSDSNRVKMV